MSVENSQFQPIYRLSLFREDGSGVIVEPPACIEFDVQLDRLEQPNPLTLTAFNLDEERLTAISSNELGLVRLEAGYQFANNMAIIFEGEISRASVNERVGNDFAATILAGEGELAWRRSTIEQRFEEGQAIADVVRFALRRMPNITEGDLSGLNGQSLSSDWVVAGPTRKFFRDIAKTTNTRWSVQRTSLDFVSNEQASNIFPVTQKTFDTGLIEAELDDTGIEDGFELDPAAKPNGILELDLSLIHISEPTRPY